MTYCVGVRLDDGLIFASDSRTHAGVDNYATFCKMSVFERPGDRVLVLLSSGGQAATQTVINLLRKRATGEAPHVWSVDSMFDVANLVSDAMRDIERRDGPFLESGGLKFNASFILGGQIAGEPMRLFRLHAEGNLKRRFDAGDPYFGALTRQWLEGTRKVFRDLPPLQC